MSRSRSQGQRYEMGKVSPDSIRSYLERWIDEYQKMVTGAAYRYACRPILQHFSKFSELCRSYEEHVRSFRTIYEGAIYRENLETLIGRYKRDILPRLKHQWDYLIGEMEKFLSRSDADYTNDVSERNELKRNFYSNISEFFVRYHNLTVFDEPQQTAHYENLHVDTVRDIEGLCNLHDRNSITLLKVAIAERLQELRDELDLIEQKYLSEKPLDVFPVNDSDFEF